MAGGVAQVLPAFFKRALHIALRRLQCGCQPDDDACGKRNRAAEKQHAPIQAKLLDAGNEFQVASATPRKNLRSPVGKKESETTAESGKQQALRKQLANQAGATGADG